MKKLNKSQKGNLLFLALLLVFLFTPIGKLAKIYINRLLAFSPSVENVEDQQTLTSEDFDVRLQSLNGQQLNFVKFQGEVTLVNFWATWCPPCIAEMPSLQHLYNDYGDKVNFVFVTNEDRKTIQAFLAKHEYKLPVYQNLQSWPAQLEHSSIPTTYVIDKKGAIVIDETGAADWNSKSTRELLDSLLAE